MNLGHHIRLEIDTCLVDLDDARFDQLLDFAGNVRVLQVTEMEEEENVGVIFG